MQKNKRSFPAIIVQQVLKLLKEKVFFFSILIQHLANYCLDITDKKMPCEIMWQKGNKQRAF